MFNWNHFYYYLKCIYIRCIVCTAYWIPFISSGFWKYNEKNLQQNEKKRVSHVQTTKLYFKLYTMNSMGFCVINRLILCQYMETYKLSNFVLLSKCVFWILTQNSNNSIMSSIFKKKTVAQNPWAWKPHLFSSRYI